MIKTITTDEKSQDQRLDKFLTEKLKDKTRSQIKKMISQGLVEVDGQVAKVHRFLKPGEKIVIKQKKEGKKLAKGESASGGEKIIEPGIIFETKDYLALDKPVGLLVHPTDKGEINTLANWLIKKYPKMEQIGQEEYRAGIIHRLDRDVSGVMLAVKTNKAFEHLKALFKKREVNKEYTAIVYGQVSNETGEIELPIGRNKDGQFVAHPKKGTEKFNEKDKLAKTTYSVLEYLKGYTVLKVNILTGRTHQIRAHLSAIGHPIIGDQIYKPKKKFFNFLRSKIKVVDPGRIFLHSTKIGFKDLNGAWQEYKSPLPAELNKFIDAKKQ